jgi:hypothetical protein
MGFLQRWLDEPDESIARYAKQFYALTFVFMAVFAWQMGQAVWNASRGRGDLFDLVSPSISAFLTLAMYSLALDGRRSYKQMKRDREASAPKP